MSAPSLSSIATPRSRVSSRKLQKGGADPLQALPCYTLLADKWIDGEPSNNDFFGLKYEYDYRETQLRAGGDVKGLMSDRSLDYLQGMGYRSIYIAGTFFLNMPWQADGACFSPYSAGRRVVETVRSMETDRQVTLLSISPSSTRTMELSKTGSISSTSSIQGACT